ncbi:hypothetical protein BDF20DRAFT_914797 [Mycotypha africana]|uniref:uncharacterized protein n=1 Tax=Mycotypha africana TaxID=64632 RepID=UPI002300AAAD|nr:uncharacterized protein BDF20DRAFT_914797 [Mycotypha africana]KAI8973339.1 hypothetical protein BDF20DRAFT_914797 [Mycotypha africana]
MEDIVSPKIDWNQHKAKRFYSSVEPASMASSTAPSTEVLDKSTWLKKHIAWAKNQYSHYLLGADRVLPPYEKLSTRSAVGVRRGLHSLKLLLYAISSVFLIFYAFRVISSSTIFQTAVSTYNDETEYLVELQKITSLRELMKDLPSSQSIRDIFLHYASHSHLAGSRKDHDLAKWTRDQFEKFGLSNATIETYYPYLNYPIHRELAIVSGPTELLYTAKLRETEDDAVPPFHAYSANGNVTGSVVYVNYGRLEDFEYLVSNKVDVRGTIALIRHGMIPSGMKVQIAETFGCLGALIFTDPEYASSQKQEYVVTNKHNVIGPTTVYRDTVQYGFIYPGDPYTPGYPATFNATRNATASNLPTIPSLPISWSDALPLLRATQGLGLTLDNWVGGLKEVNYFTGPSVAQVKLVNFNEYKIKPIWNVMARIEGAEDEKAIIIGNHRDAWDQGAADPSSGSAVLLELARVFGILLEKGWKPRRTIILASWDANEYGTVGSTEYVEEHQEWLDKNAIVYLNVDHAVTGPHFQAEASPLLYRIITEVTDMVIDPITSETVFKTWNHRHEKKMQRNNMTTSLIPPVGSSTHKLDSVAFFEHAGISSLSMSFESKEFEAVAHSAFDSITWMERIGDPTFEYHQAMVKIWGLLTMRLSTDVILPLYPLDYALVMKEYLDTLTSPDADNNDHAVEDMKKHHKKHKNKKKHPKKEEPTVPAPAPTPAPSPAPSPAPPLCSNSTREDYELPILASSLKSFYKTAIKFDAKLQDLDHFSSSIGISKNKKKHKKLLEKVKKANERLANFERVFVKNDGLLLDRPWYKHAIYGRSAKSGLLEAFPSIVESRELSDIVKLKETETVLAAVLKNARSMLSKGKMKNLSGQPVPNDGHEDEDSKESITL